MVRSSHATTAIFLSISVLACTSSHQAISQSMQTPQQRKISASSQPRPLSLAHLYWHFLVYQNYLDTKAAALEAQGKDGGKIHDDLQTRLRFSDADFAPIRNSSGRLATEVKTLDAKATEIRSAGSFSWTRTELKALTAQREDDINTEIANLTQALSPQKKAALDAFLVDFFSPKKIEYQPPSSNGQVDHKGAQQ